MARFAPAFVGSGSSHCPYRLKIEDRNGQIVFRDFYGNTVPLRDGDLPELIDLLQQIQGLITHEA